MQATKEMLIQQVIELDEGTADILMNAGMHCLGCAMAHGESIEQACSQLLGIVGQWFSRIDRVIEIEPHDVFRHPAVLQQRSCHAHHLHST